MQVRGGRQAEIMIKSDALLQKWAGFARGRGQLLDSRYFLSQRVSRQVIKMLMTAQHSRAESTRKSLIKMEFLHHHHKPHHKTVNNLRRINLNYIVWMELALQRVELSVSQVKPGQTEATAEPHSP